MYLAGAWHKLQWQPAANADPIGRLDVTGLQERLLAPLLGLVQLLAQRLVARLALCRQHRRRVFARQAKARFIFAEKENNVLVLRRGFTMAPGEGVLVVEDVVTRGGRVVECLDIIRKAGGKAAGIAMLVDRSAGTTKFEVPALSLLELSFPTYAADALPPELAALPVQKPGS